MGLHRLGAHYCLRYSAYSLPKRPVIWETAASPLYLVRCLSASTLDSEARQDGTQQLEPDEGIPSRLQPSPDDYGRQLFTDKCRLRLFAGSGGHGCVSFLREKFIAEGPANGGDGGSGGNIYIQAVSSETSLHKIARQGSFKAGRGRSGQGKGKGGQRGEDIVLRVPVGTVVREISRLDPVAIEEQARKQQDSIAEADQQRLHKWIVYPSASPRDLADDIRPSLPRPRRPALAALQPAAPIHLDLSKVMKEPKLLVAGALGGLGNPHFVTKAAMRPKFATKGDGGMRLEVELELKLLADLGFVGFPNAGKSTLLRALSRSRARVGDWAFTTLHPNIGTVVLDDNHGRAKIHALDAFGQRRTKLSVADIPGIVPDAHLDRGLGLDFLRHIERARVLAFVVDLGNGDPIETLKALWKELAEFERIKNQPAASGDANIISWRRFGSSALGGSNDDSSGITPAAPLVSNPSRVSIIQLPPISTKPWFVVGTKSDIDNTHFAFKRLCQYLEDVEHGKVEHPAGSDQKWRGSLKAIPISAIRGHGVDVISRTTVQLLSAA